MPEESIVLRWSAYEHEHVRRGADWYWALGVVAVSIAITSVLFHDALFAVLILVAAGTIAILSQTPSDIAEFEISDRGIRINGKLHRYSEVLAFWVEDKHQQARAMLLIDTPRFLSPNLIIPIEHIDPDQVRAYLKQHVKERRMKEPLSHKILEYFGF